jgi:hypothetical protein
MIGTELQMMQKNCTVKKELANVTDAHTNSKKRNFL